MKAKKISLIMLAISFLVATILSCIFVFSVRKVQIEFTVTADFNTSQVTKSLEKFNGRNLLFLNLQEVDNTIKENRYIETVLVEKQFPNIIKVHIKERVGIYYIKNLQNYYLVDENGVVLEEYDQIPQITEQNKKITISAFNIVPNGAGGLEFVPNNQLLVDTPALGTKLVEQQGGILYTTFAMSKQVNLTDCIEKVEIYNLAEKRLARFYTYSGVELLILDAEVNGVAKIANAFTYYNNLDSDFKKSNGNIICASETSNNVWNDSTLNDYLLGLGS